MTNVVFRERILINSMFSVAPNIVFAPNMTQNAERKHRTQDTNTANSVHRQSDRRPNVNVTASEIDIENVETLHCIEWANGPKNSGRNTKDIMRSDDGNQFQEQMLVSVTQNGM